MIDLVIDAKLHFCNKKWHFLSISQNLLIVVYKLYFLPIIVYYILPIFCQLLQVLFLKNLKNSAIFFTFINFVKIVVNLVIVLMSSFMFVFLVFGSIFFYSFLSSSMFYVLHFYSGIFGHFIYLVMLFLVEAEPSS